MLDAVSSSAGRSTAGEIPATCCSCPAAGSASSTSACSAGLTPASGGGEPGPDLLLTLSTFWRVIADSKLAKSHATSSDPWAKRWLKNHDAGFGPFKLADLSPGRHVVWVAHKEHPFPPKLDQITFRQVPESSSRLAMLMTGEAQAAEYLLATDMQRVENSNDLRLWNFQGYVIASCPMNPKYPPLGAQPLSADAYQCQPRTTQDPARHTLGGPARGESAAERWVSRAGEWIGYDAQGFPPV